MLGCDAAGFIQQQLAIGPPWKDLYESINTE